MIFLLLAAVVYTSVWYFASLALGRADIMDSAWGIGFVVLAWGWHILVAPLSVFFLGLLTLHQVRLSGYIAWRMAQKPEDKRYAAWRRDWGDTFWWRSYFQIFVLQGGIIALVLGALVVPKVEAEPSWVLVLGGALWVYGMAYEVGGDWQLMRFKASPANTGKVLATGLWARTRHPNYWGECCIWWGYWLILGMPLWGILAPVLMTFLLLKVSGVAMTERTMRGSDAYETYKKTVPPFAPTGHFF